MGSLVGGLVRCFGPRLIFILSRIIYLVVKEFIAKWYKNLEDLRRRQKPLPPSHQTAAAGRAPTSPKSRSARRSICSEKTDSRRPRLTISAPPPASTARASTGPSATSASS